MTHARIRSTALASLSVALLGLAVSSHGVLAQAPPQLAPMRTSASEISPRLKGFEERMRAGRGEFFNQRMIEARNAVMTVDILRQARAIKIVGQSGATFAFSARQTTGCAMQIYLDGVPLAGAGSRVDAPFDLNQLPSPKEIMGIEVYAGDATTPIWLPKGPSGGRMGCGVVLVWTRDGSEA